MEQLGPRYRTVIDRLWAMLTKAATARGAEVVETRADEFFAVFEQPAAALDAAIAVRRAAGVLVARGRAGPGAGGHPQRLPDDDGRQLHRSAGPRRLPHLWGRPRQADPGVR